MKKLLLAAAVLLIATLLTVLYVWNETRADDAAANAAEAGARTASGSAEPVPDEPAAPRSAELASTAPGEATRVEQAHSRLDPERTAWVEGTLRMPPGVPGDEAAELLVLSVTGSAALNLSEASEAQLAADERVLSRAPIGADGAFRAALPRDSERVWLTVRARYLFLDSPHELATASAGEPLELRPELGAWVTGRVLLPSGAQDSEFDAAQTELALMFDPLKFAGLNRPPRGLREHETRADAELRFEFRGVAAGSEYDARVSPERFAALKTARFAVRPGLHATVDLPLTRGGTLRGRVIDDSGAPLAGAQLVASIDPIAFGQAGFEVREGASAADGSFELAAVTAGKVDLRATHAGFLERKLSIEVPEGGSAAAQEIVLGRGGVIAGRVTWPDGAPVVDTVVEADFDPAALGGMSAFNAMQGAEGEARTDADGRFEISGLGKGPFVVHAAARPAGSPESGAQHRAHQQGVKPETRDLALTLQPPVAVSGRVVDRAGQPVAGAVVRGHQDAGGVLRGLGGRTVEAPKTGADGGFELDDLSPGNWDLGARAEGYTRSATVALSVPRESGAPALELVLDRGGSVSGVVLGTGGTPASGATVQVKLSMNSLANIREEGDVRGANATTDEQGRFKLAGLAAGVVPLVARADGCAESAVVEVDVRPEQESADVVLRLRLGGRITGEVFGKDGRALAGAQIMVQASADPLNQRFANADSAGRFLFENVAPGTYNVMHFPMSAMQASEGGGDAADFTAMFAEMKMASATVAEGEEVHVVLGAPPKDPVELSGRVLAGDEGVGGVVLTFIADGSTSMGGLKFTNTDASGRYRTQLESPGRYMASIQRPGVAGQQQTVSMTLQVPDGPAYERDFKLPLGAIAGRVLDPDGEPAAGARVSLTVDGPVPNGTLVGENYAEITTDDQGRFELVWLKPQTYTVSVGGSPFGGLFGGTASAGRQVREGVVVRADERTEGVDFRLHKPGRISGIVRGSSGEPAAQAAIFLRDAQGRMLERFSMTATDSSGRFTYEGVEPGEYSVLARAAGETSNESVRTRVKEGETADVELALAPGTVLIVALSGDDGQPLDCSVTVLDDDGRQVNGTMSLTEIMEAFSNGSFSSKEQRVGPLPPGKYRVTVTTPDGKKVTKPVSLSGQAERRLNVRL